MLQLRTGKSEIKIQHRKYISSREGKNQIKTTILWTWGELGGGAIETPSKVITYNPTEINEAFKKYYMDLYMSQWHGELSKIES